MSKLTKEQRDLLALQVAGLAAQLRSEDEIAEKLGISKRQVRNAKRSDEYKKALDEFQNSIKAQAKAYIARAGNKLVPKALAALERALDEKQDVQAVKTVFKVFGIIDQDQETQGDTSINVILPSTEVKDVKSE